jgi:phosphotriesterase-related protein
MKAVNTVLGPVPAEKLGKTLIHEHFLYGFCGFQGDTTLGPFDEAAAEEVCIKNADMAKEYGIHTVVDATTNECGRDPLFLKKMAEKTGLHIICSTGYYFEPESAYGYWKFRSASADITSEIEEMYVTELTKGIGKTGICAGVIKLASSANQITDLEQCFFKAAARAQQKTGCVIITHTQLGTMGPEQAKLLIENGADPKKIAIGHMSGNLDYDYHRRVLDQGVYENIDRLGLEGELFHTPTNDKVVTLIKKLCEAGYGDKINLGHDLVDYQLGRPNVMTGIMAETLKGADWSKIGKQVIPEMRKQGIPEEQIDRFFLDNPMHLFGD